LKAKRDAVFEGLTKHLGNVCTWSEPVGGLFIWVGLPDDVDLDRLFELGAERNVQFARGARFHVRGEDVKNIRLAFGHPTVEEIEEGTRLLAECIRDARRAPASASAS
jgi:2-aminoadipate transaminase